jgi:hypothetical protein
MGGILELIKLIYGSKALSKVLGTRTNVIRLPDNELKQYTKNDLNIEAASDKLAQKAKADMKELLADYPRMNDAEKLIFEGNLRRLGNKLGVTEKGPAADVLEFGTGEKVSPEGIMSLTEKAGQKNPPTTLMGNLESRVKQLEASGEDLSKMKGQTYDEFMNDITQGQRTMIKLEDEGLVRATAREIIDKDIKSKKIKLPKEIEADFKQGGGEPIDVFRQFYGEDALEQLNSMVPDFKQMYSSKEAAEAAIKKFKFKFKADRPPGSISIKDAKKAEQEFGINKPKQTEVTDITAKVYRNTDPDELINEYNKNLDLLSQVDEEGGTLIGYQQFQKLQNRNTEIEKILNSIGIKSADSPEGKKITEALIGKPKAPVTELVTAEKIILDMKNMDPMDAMKEANKVLKKEGKYKNLKEEDVERIMEDTNDFIFGRDIPEDPEGFAVGGRVEMAGGGITKLVKKAMEFFSDNDPVSAYKKYLKYVKETAQKDPAKLAPEMGGIVVGSELIHRGLRRKLKEAKEKNDTDDSEDTTTEDRTEKAAGGVSQGLDYLTGIERRGYVGGGFGSVPVDPMEAMYVNTFGFNPFPKYGFNSYMDYNTARTTGTPMNQNISDLEDYLGTLESAREINLPGVTKDLSAEDISRLQEEYVKKMAKTSNALNPTVTASTSTSTPDYRQQALSEMLSRYNVSSLGDIKNFNYLIPGYKDKNNLQVRAFETRIPDLAVSRRAQQLEDAAIRAQQDQEAYKNRISQVDPNALRNSYLQNLQNTSSQSIDQFQSKLRSNLVPRKQAAQGLNYLTGL